MDDFLKNPFLWLVSAAFWISVVTYPLLAFILFVILVIMGIIYIIISAIVGELSTIVRYMYLDIKDDGGIINVIKSFISKKDDEDETE